MPALWLSPSLYNKCQRLSLCYIPHGSFSVYCDAQVYGAGLAPADQTSLGAVLKPRLEATVSALQLFSDSYRRDGASADSHLLAKSTQGLALYFGSFCQEGSSEAATERSKKGVFDCLGE